MNGSVCPVTAAVAATGIAGAAWAAAKSEDKPDATKFASVSALVFAAQMMNFPINGGTSGHLLGGVLASALLGTPFGVLAIAMVLAVQCLLFSDGGLSVLGANVVNMSLIGAGLGGLIAGHLRGRSPLSLARLGFAAWISVVVAALACSIELALAGDPCGNRAGRGVDHGSGICCAVGACGGITQKLTGSRAGGGLDRAAAESVCEPVSGWSGVGGIPTWLFARIGPRLCGPTCRVFAARTSARYGFDRACRPDRCGDYFRPRLRGVNCVAFPPPHRLNFFKNKYHGSRLHIH